ncbi:MAG: lysine--tRNA ligase [Candidatus Bathyarchaeia archaeon]
MSVQLHWIEKIIADLETREETIQVFSTAKTPSGPIHVGVGRELVYCSVFEKALRERGQSTRFLFFVDDFDSLKSFPSNVPSNFSKQRELIGKPLHLVPCPFGDCESWARHYATELLESFPGFGFFPEIIWTHELYRKTEMKELIRTALKRVEEIRRILTEVTAATLSDVQREKFLRQLDGWYPCLVVCENCGKLKDGEVTSYDEARDTVTYKCGACGTKSEANVSQSAVKLRWRIDWPAKWALFRVTCEPAGKDHTVKGGAYDTGESICQRVFGWKGPYRVPYEWILLGERAMKTHKGISFTFKEWQASAPEETYRYMVLREEPRKHITFLPDRIPQLLDEFERTEQIFFGRQRASSTDEERNLKMIYPYVITHRLENKLPVQLPFRFALILTQLSEFLTTEKIILKASEVIRRIQSFDNLTNQDLINVKARLQQARYWLEHYGPEELKFKISSKLDPMIKERLEPQHKKALSDVKEMLQSKEWTDIDLQYEIFELGKRYGLKSRIFEILYLVFLGRSFGPRLAPFMLSLDRAFVLQRITEALD